MNADKALMLVRHKCMEEQQGITSGEKADEYKRACKVYPAMMTTAHHLWAREVARNMP